MRYIFAQVKEPDYFEQIKKVLIGMITHALRTKPRDYTPDIDRGDRYSKL